MKKSEDEMTVHCDLQGSEGPPMPPPIFGRGDVNAVPATGLASRASTQSNPEAADQKPQVPTRIRALLCRPRCCIKQCKQWRDQPIDSSLFPKAKLTRISPRKRDEAASRCYHCRCRSTRKRVPPASLLPCPKACQSWARQSLAGSV